MRYLLLTLMTVFSLLLPLKPSFAADVEEYRMCGGEHLYINVYGHNDLSSNGDRNNPYIVRPDGKFTMPLVGEFDVKGKTVAQATNELTTCLEKYIKQPKVTINIIRWGSVRVYVLGEVKHQGTYELSKSHRLLDAVGKAGGFTRKSAKTRVYVVRAGAEEPCLKVNLKDLLRKGDTSKNIVLYEGDSVYFVSNHKLF